MKKNYLKFLLAFIMLCGLSGAASAQKAYIPDPNFRAWLLQNYASCMSGDSLITNCTGVVNATSVNVGGRDINDLTGIEYFVSLQRLDCYNNQLTALPPLPASLVRLNCWYNQLTTLPALPAALEYLECGDNQLTSLPALPATLEYLECGYSALTVLPALPAALQVLNCRSSQLTSLPALPAGLQQLVCYINQLTSLPALPATLKEIYARDNQITTLPALPAALEILDCGRNQLTALPALPAALRGLECNYNQLTTLPTLPSLQFLDCRVNALTVLPSLPATLISLTCSDNQLTTLPVLPAALQTLMCSNNQLTSLPVLPASLTHLDCYSNQLSFEDLEPTMSIIINQYIPQADIPVSPSVYAIAQGSTLTLTFSTGGTANRYQWFKGNTAVSSISTSPNFTKTNMTAADAGVYTCRVTNTIVTDLTLSTTPITVNISACPAVDFTINGSSDTVVYVSTLDAPLALVGTPAGGTFSGNGVLGDTFYPDVPGSECDSDLPTFDSTQCVLSGGTPGPGNIAPATNPNGWPITYTYTDGMGCNVSVTKYVRLLDPTTNSWTGTASTDWLDPANWSAGIVPDATKTAFIPASATHMPVITTAGVQCKDLVIGEGASFTTAAASVVTVAGNFSNDGSFTANGTVIFSGTGAQALSGSGTITFSTLQISNATGVSLQSAISVASVLRLVNGTLTSNGHLTLLSSAARTALIDDFSTGYSGTLAGNITAQRYLPNQAVAYRYVASPVTGAQVRALAPFQNVSYYNEPQVTAAASNIDAGWVIISDTTTVINPVQGLSTYAEGNRTLFFTGTANTGVFSKTVSRTNSGNFTGYNMIGNPYPSPVSWSAIWNLNTNTHIHKTVYVWNSANNKVALYNLTTGIATNGGSNEIAQGQAFRIRVNTVGYSTTFNLDNTVRLSTSSGSFLRGEQNQVAELLRLVLSSEHDKAGYETVIHSATGATEGMDAAYDASFADDGGLDVLYSAADGEKMSINALPLLEGKRTIELGMEVQQAGEYILSATEMSHFAPGTKIYLEDRKSGRFINLETTPAYRFMADKADRNRFRLHFNPVESAEKQAARVYAFSNHIVVELDRTAPANVTVYNLLGQPVKEVTSANRGVIEFSADVPEGVYIVQVRTGAQVVRQKVFVEGR